MVKCTSIPNVSLASFCAGPQWSVGLCPSRRRACSNGFVLSTDEPRVVVDMLANKCCKAVTHGELCGPWVCARVVTHIRMKCAWFNICKVLFKWHVLPTPTQHEVSMCLILLADLRLSTAFFCCDGLVQIDSPAPVFALSELLPSTTHTVISAHMMHETSKRHAIQKNHAIGQDAEIDACFWCCNMHCFCCWLHARKCANIDPATCMFIYIVTTVAMPLATCPKPLINTFSVATPSANGNKPTTTGASSEQCATTTSYSSFYKPHDLMHFLMFSWATTIVTLHGV